MTSSSGLLARSSRQWEIPSSMHSKHSCSVADLQTFAIHFYSARNARIASAVLATAIPTVRPSVGLSVCLSVCLSVTRQYCVKTTARSTVQFALLDSKMCLFL